MATSKETAAKQAQRTPGLDALHKDAFYNFYEGWLGKTPANAIRLAIADHEAHNQGRGITEYTHALRVAERQCNTFDDLVTALQRCARVCESMAGQDDEDTPMNNAFAEAAAQARATLAKIAKE